MSLFNDKLKKITLKEVLILIILLFVVQYLFNTLNLINVDSIWIYILIIIYFIFRIGNGLSSLKADVADVFSLDSLKFIVLVVILNIFMSYGFLYLADYILNFIDISHIMPFSIVGVSLISTIFVSPIAEELIFRGVFLNRFRLMVPTVFAILISALFFASLHSYGNIISAFIFALCMSILYLKTENILVPIFAHFLNNLLAEIIVFADSNKILFTNEWVILIMSVLAIISFVLISTSLIKEFNNINDK